MVVGAVVLVCCIPSSLYRSTLFSQPFLLLSLVTNNQHNTGKNICDSHFAQVEKNLKAFARHTPIGKTDDNAYIKWLQQLSYTAERGGIRNTAIVELGEGLIADFKIRHPKKEDSFNWFIKKYSHFTTPYLKATPSSLVETIKKISSVSKSTIQHHLKVGSSYTLVPKALAAPQVTPTGTVQIKVVAGATAATAHIYIVVSSSSGYTVGNTLQFNGQDLFRVASLVSENNKMCPYGCLVGARNTPMYTEPGKQRDNSMYVLLPLGKAKKRDDTDRTRANVLNLERDGLRDALRYVFGSKMNQRWKNNPNCPAPTYCLINKNDHIRDTDEYLGSLFIDDAVHDDLTLFLDSPIFAAVKGQGKCKRTGFKSKCQGLGTRFMYFVTKVKDPAMTFTDDQKNLVSTGNKGRATNDQRQVYEQAMGDRTWIDTVLRPHIATLWHNIDNQ